MKCLYMTCRKGDFVDKGQKVNKGPLNLTRKFTVTPKDKANSIIHNFVYRVSSYYDM